ncbi:MAG: hypothetical protein KBI47_14060, partial [Armatimonadetes bacterium]|nr:hypothetical protein [Armatimonadota bacterium]
AGPRACDASDAVGPCALDDGHIPRLMHWKFRAVAGHSRGQARDARNVQRAGPRAPYACCGNVRR